MTLPLLIAGLFAIALGMVIATRIREHRRRAPTRALDPERLALVHQVSRWAEESDPVLDDYCAEVKRDTGWDMAFLNVVEVGVIVSVGRANMPPALGNVPIRNSLCAVIAARDEPLALDRGSLAVMQVGGCAAGFSLTRYVGVPIHKGGHVIGALAVADRHGHRSRLSERKTLAKLERWGLEIESVLAPV